MTDRHADKQHSLPPPQQQAGEHAAQQPQRDSNQSVQQLSEPMPTASCQQLLPGQAEEDQWLLQQQEPLRHPQQPLPQQLQSPKTTPSPDEDPLLLTEQDPQHHQQPTEQLVSSGSALLPTQARPQQVQEQQQQQQDASGKVTPTLQSVKNIEEWSTRQLVVYSLRPSRLWAFLGLGIPGGLASSVQSAAFEVTTAMAGVLGKAPA